MGPIRRFAAIVYGVLLIAIGLLLALGGTQLIWLGGTWYYLPAGLLALTSGWNVLKGKWWTGAATYGILMLLTLFWSLYEVGLEGWALMPRVVSPIVLGLPFLIGALTSKINADRQGGYLVVGTAALLAIAVWATSGFTPAPAKGAQPAIAADAPGDWPNFGNDRGGSNFSPLGDIKPDNVGQLKAVWTVPLGPMPAKPAGQIDATPLKVGDHVYVCDPFNDVLDIEPETGKVRWTFHPQRNNSGISVARCRGVAYYEIPGATGPCSKRVYTAVSDGASLYAIDAETGQVCTSFGENGRANLLRGIKQRELGYYNVSSAPTLIRGKLVFGGVVADGQYVGEPSGVVRAYDAVTGKLAWAWDIDKPHDHREPAEGQYYSPGTPNAWGPMSSDEALGLIFVPTGNSTPDYWGGYRSSESNKFNSSIVALDGETGEVRWHFQTTHYDVWDYDVASKPVLFDLQKDGKTIPALIQPTKRGELFVLDRRTGEPLFPVQEKPAPQAGAVEKLSPTQPWSTAFPHMMGPLLTEQRMWGISALDQLWCRIQFKQARYDGSMTAPGTTSWIQDPGYVGGVDWGSASVDQARQLALIVSSQMVNYNRLVPRSDPAAQRAKAAPGGQHGLFVAQEGTPYAADIHPFMSPLGIPCQAPPYGLLNAIDLTTGKMVWSRPLGTAHDLGPDLSGKRQPFRSRLPFTLGTPNFGGATTTVTGLTFVGAAGDHTFRAFDSQTGKLLFEAELPGNGTASPMTYRGKDGRQYVAIVSEAPMKNGQVWGAVTAFALPK